MKGTTFPQFVVVVAFVALVTASSCYGQNEDDFMLSPMEQNQLVLSCCKNLKTMGTVDVCLLPCCHGYHEQVSDTPQLGVVSWCERDQLASKRRRNSMRSRANNKNLRQFLETAALLPSN